MRVTLALQGDTSSERLDDLSRELTAELGRQQDLEVRTITTQALPGERAAEIGLLGQLALTFITAGAASALIGCLKAYIERERSLKFRLKREDGTELELEARHLQGDRLNTTLQTLERFTAG